MIRIVSRKTKITLSTILIMLCLIIFVATLCLSIFKLEDSSKRANIYAASYDLENCIYKDGVYKFSGDQYDDYSSFKITSFLGWRSFQSLVNNGVDFEKKTIYLETGLQFLGDELSIGVYDTEWFDENFVFKGNFDGGGHTLSNFIFGASLNYSYQQSCDDADGQEIKYFVGLFTYFKGRLSNLRIKNAKTRFPFHAYGTQAVAGGLVGFLDEEATIENCSVENIIAVNNNYSFYTAGIVGAFYCAGHGSSVTGGQGLQIKNCYVDCKDDFDMIGPAKHLIDDPGKKRRHGVYVENCVAKSGRSSIYDNAYNINTQKNNLTGSTSPAESFDKWKGYFNMSVIGGSSDKSIWYFGDTDYNDGWPYLRKYISWKYISFAASNATIIGVDDSTATGFYVPEDANLPATRKISNEDKTVTTHTGGSNVDISKKFFAREVKCSGESTCSQGHLNESLLNYTLGGDNVYNITYEQVYVSVSIKLINEDTNEQEECEHIQAPCGSKIKLESNPYTADSAWEYVILNEKQYNLIDQTYFITNVEDMEKICDEEIHDTGENIDGEIEIKFKKKQYGILVL